MKIELKNIKVNLAFSEETTCFIADVFVNGIKTAYAKNDGHGGNSFYTAYEGKRELLREAEAFAETLPSKQYGTITIKSNLENIIEDAIDDFTNAKEKIKFEKRLLKDTETDICFGVPNSGQYRRIGFGKQKLSYIVTFEKGRIALENLITRVKGELKEGEVILNKNLKELGF